MNTKSKTPILLIEDNKADADLIQIYLSDVGFRYEFYHTDSLVEGFDLINTRDIEIVLLDLSLTDSSGFKTLSKFLDKVNYLPVIVMTGQNNEIIGNQSIKAGAQDFLVKGHFDGKQLGRSIRYALQRYKSHSKLEVMARELAISENRYLEAQELAHFGNWEMDIVSFGMKWSDEIFRIFGFDPEVFEPTISDYIKYVHLEDKERVEKFFEDAGKDSRLHRIEHRIIVGGQHIKYVAVQAKMYFDEYYEKALLVGALQDITERKLSEQLLFEKQISNQEAKIQEEVMEDLSFQIRTPLNSVINLLYLLENTPVSTQQSEYVGNLKTSVDDLSIVLNNLMNVSVISGGKLAIKEETLNTLDFLNGLKKLVSIKAESAKINFDFNISNHLPEKFNADAGKISLVFYNLIDLLFKNLKKEDKLKAEFEIITPVAGEPFLEMNFSDDGTMINFSDLSTSPSEFNPREPELNKTDRNLLNLRIAEKLVAALAGEMIFDKKTVTGNKVQVKIPIKIFKKQNVFVGQKPDFPIRILMAEDHILNQISTRKVLLSWSDTVSVDIAGNGQKALEAYKTGEYDLILMDIQMPVMNGIECTKKIREISEVPIIAMTANSSKHEADKCIAVGMNAYLSKPFKPADLYEKIMSCLVMQD